MFIFSGLAMALIVGMSPFSADARGGKREKAGRYAGSGSYSSGVITQNQNYVATTDTPTGGVGSNPLGGQTCDNEGLCTKCKRLVAQSLQSYCRENECSKASNAFIVAKALPLSSTIVNIDQAHYDSPSVATQSPLLTQGQGYDQTLVQQCQPHLVKNVEELLPAYYDIVTEECHTQYKSAIDHYMANNDGGFKMGGVGEKGTVRNFEILEYFKLHSTPDYTKSLYQDTSSEDYFFTAYCMTQMADSVKRSLIDLYIPDLYTYQRNMCRRSYEMAMQDFCDDGDGHACKGEMDYMNLIMSKEFRSMVRSDETQINCAEELAQDVREALIEEVTRKQNMCAREMGQYNAEQDRCMFSIALIDAKNFEIQRKMYFEGETVKCNTSDFVDPYSKEGRKRLGKSWFASKAGASMVSGAGGAVLGAMVGGSTGRNLAKKTRINRAMETVGVSEEKRPAVRKKVTGLGGNYVKAVAKLTAVMGEGTDQVAKDLIDDLYTVNKQDKDGTPLTDDKEWKIKGMSVSTNTAKRVGQAVGAVAGGAGAVAGSNYVYQRFYKETKCYKTWRSARLGDEASGEKLGATDRPFIEWGRTKSLPKITKGLEVELDSLPVYDREYKGDPKWEDK